MKEKIILTKVNGEKMKCNRCGKVIENKDFNLEEKSLCVIKNQIYCKKCYYNPTTRTFVKLL